MLGFKGLSGGLLREIPEWKIQEAVSSSCRICLFPSHRKSDSNRFPMRMEWVFLWFYFPSWLKICAVYTSQRQIELWIAFTNYTSKFPPFSAPSQISEICDPSSCSDARELLLVTLKSKIRILSSALWAVLMSPISFPISYIVMPLVRNSELLDSHQALHPAFCLWS